MIFPAGDPTFFKKYDFRVIASLLCLSFLSGMLLLVVLNSKYASIFTGGTFGGVLGTAAISILYVVANIAFLVPMGMVLVWLGGDDKDWG